MGGVSERLAVGLDVPDLEQAKPLVASLAGQVGWLKVGSELFSAEGPPAVALAATGARVFLDLKFHDIPNTVASAVRAATRIGVGMLTVHSSGGAAMLRAARDAATAAADEFGIPRPAIIGVTVLTSMAPADLKEVGFAASSAEDQVARLTDLAITSGLDGVVASPREVVRVRAIAGDSLRIVTPGIRAAGAAADDQARTATPAEAIAAGSDVLVVARPIIRAEDCAAAARAVLTEIEAGLAARPG